MKRLGVLIALLLTFAAAFPPPSTEAAGCPIYRACRWYVDLGCECEGFYCNDQFICGEPVYP